MKFIPQDLILIILEKLMDINPILCARISKYWYYRAMPKIWGYVNLNEFVNLENFYLHSRCPFFVEEYSIKHYSFWIKEWHLNSIQNILNLPAHFVKMLII